MFAFKNKLGIGIMLFFSILGCILSLFNFFLPGSPISYTAGAELVIVTTMTIISLTLLLYFLRRSKWERGSLLILIMGLLLGTLFAAWLLESWILFVMLLFVLLGWFIQVLTR